MSERSERLGMAAGNYFKSGYNCCEAIVETFRQEARASAAAWATPETCAGLWRAASW